jgi:hypothetical protein
MKGFSFFFSDGLSFLNIFSAVGVWLTPAMLAPGFAQRPYIFWLIKV